MGAGRSEGRGTGQNILYILYNKRIYFQEKKLISKNIFYHVICEYLLRMDNKYM